MEADRVHHEGKRSVKAPKLSDLNERELSAEDIEKLAASFDEESDRGLALIGAAFAETGLEWAIYRRMPGLGETIGKKTFSGDKAPLGTFSSKIIMGRAMGIYGEETERLLNCLRQIRNQFAHRLIPIDFSTPEVAKACNGLLIPGGLKPLSKLDSPRMRYRLAANYLYLALMKNAYQQSATFEIDLS